MSWSCVHAHTVHSFRNIAMQRTLGCLSSGESIMMCNIGYKMSPPLHAAAVCETVNSSLCEVQSERILSNPAHCLLKSRTQLLLHPEVELIPTLTWRLSPDCHVAQRPTCHQNILTPSQTEPQKPSVSERQRPQEIFTKASSLSIFRYIEEERLKLPQLVFLPHSNTTICWSLSFITPHHGTSHISVHRDLLETRSSGWQLHHVCILLLIL